MKQLYSEGFCVGTLLICVIIQVATAVAGRARRFRGPMWLVVGSFCFCVLAALLPRGVGTDSAQPIRPSIIVAVVGLTTTLVVREGWWRRTAIVVHLLGGMVVTHVFVELTTGDARYTVPTTDLERRLFRPAWHTLITGVWTRSSVSVSEDGRDATKVSKEAQ